MASIRKRASKQYQARVRVQGFPESCETFLSRAAARDWTDSVERDLRWGLGPARQLAERVTVHDALARYAREVTPERKSAAHELRRIRWLQRQAFASLALTELRGSHLAQYRAAGARGPWPRRGAAISRPAPSWRHARPR